MTNSSDPTQFLNFSIPKEGLEQLERQRLMEAETVVGIDYPTMALRIAVVEETGQEILQQKWATPLIGNRARYSWRPVQRVTVKQGEEYK